MTERKRDRFSREWITSNAIEVCSQYADGVLTLRGLHYQLVSRGMTNSVQHYRRVVSAMIKARREGEIRYSQFSDQADFRNQSPTIVYFGDHDPTGEDIPRSLGDNLASDFGAPVDVQVVALTEEQCVDLELPAAPIKPGDSRSQNFEGLGQIELDAVRPETLQDWARSAIERNFDEDAFELKAEEREEGEQYRNELRAYVEGL